MSEYTTLDITREEACEMIQACRLKKNPELTLMTEEEIIRELHEYVYSGNYSDILGYCNNYRISN